MVLRIITIIDLLDSPREIVSYVGGHILVCLFNNILFIIYLFLDSSAAVKNGGCFNGESFVRLVDGNTRKMSELGVGDLALSMRSDGVLEYSEVIAFMDRDDSGYGLFYTIHTEDGKSITLTAKHLIYVANENTSLNIDNAEVVYADSVQEQQYLLIRNSDVISFSRVKYISVDTKQGIYAPLTKHGTLIVDDVIVSCYAFIDNVAIAHASFAPMRAFHDISSYFSPGSLSVEMDNSTRLPTGVHWYANILYTVGKRLFSRDILYVH